MYRVRSISRRNVGASRREKQNVGQQFVCARCVLVLFSCYCRGECVGLCEILPVQRFNTLTLFFVVLISVSDDVDCGFWGGVLRLSGRLPYSVYKCCVVVASWCSSKIDNPNIAFSCCADCDEDSTARAQVRSSCSCMLCFWE